MIQVLPCPSCREYLVLPPGVSQQTLLQCPHCGYQQVLGEALESEFGTWQVVGDAGPLGPATEEDGSTELFESTGSSDNSNAIQSSPDADHAVTIESASMGNESVVSAEPVASSQWRDAKPLAHDRLRRHKRKSRSAIWSALQVVLGGVAAVPVSLLLLWYVLGKDIAGAGPAVGKYVPWIVPKRFRPLQESQGFNTARQPAIPTASGLPQIGTDNVTRFKIDLPEDELLDGGTSRDTTVDELSGQLESDVDGNQIETGSTALESAAEATGPLRSIGAEKLAESAKNCEAQLSRWRTAVGTGEGDLRPIARAIYASLIDMAEIIHGLPKETETVRLVRDELQTISRTIKRNSDLQSLVTQGAAYWYDKHAQEREFFLVAVVELATVLPQVEYWEVALTDSAVFSKSFASIRIPRSLAPSLIVGQKLIVLGKVTNSGSLSGQIAPSNRVFVADYLHAL